MVEEDFREGRMSGASCVVGDRVSIGLPFLLRAISHCCTSTKQRLLTSENVSNLCYFVMPCCDSTCSYAFAEIPGFQNLFSYPSTIDGPKFKGVAHHKCDAFGRSEEEGGRR